MCEFVSWVETADGKIWFLDDDKLKTKKGQGLIEWTKCNSDLRGHGAIRHYFKLANHDGTDRECTDFTSPDNFPPEIVSAIKAGKMRGFNAQPEGLLTASTYKVYQESRASAYKIYEEALDSADRVYQETIVSVEKVYQETRTSADRVYQETIASAYWVYREAIASADRVYQETIASANKVLQEATAPAYEVYQETIASAYWDLFADPKNRNPKWINKE